MDLNLSLSKIHDKIQMGKTSVFFHLSTKHKVQEKNAVTV